MPNEMTYRIAELTDAASIAELVTQLGYPSSPAQIEARLRAIFADSSYATFVAVVDSNVVGFIGTRIGSLYESDGSYGRIMAMAVSRGHRRLGIGRRLMQLAEESMIEKGARIFVLGSGNHRKEAHAFYEDLGYTFTGRRYKKLVETSA